MKKTLVSVVFLSGFGIALAQVGINTPNPTTTLDVLAKNATGTATNVDGLLIPRVDRERALSMTGVPISTLIYVNSIATGTQTGTAVNIDATGYYYYNGTAWTKLNSSAGVSNNIYTADGTLSGNRVVTQGANTLAFTGTAANAFSVDGTTLSVNAATDKIGAGTAAPETRMDIRSANHDYGFQHSDGTVRIRTWIGATGLNGGKQAGWFGTYSNHPLDFMIGDGFKMRLDTSGFLGIGTAYPQKLLHINGNLQVVGEINVGGDGGTAGSAGTAGQILRSGGPGAAASWVNAPVDTNTNIYTNDGTLAGNRIVTQGANTLAFTGTAANAFSVDGTTLSVDAAANKIGVGTATPQKTVHVNGDLQVTNELNVGGNATTAGSAGTTGQVLTSAGPGAAPAWTTPAAVSTTNIYTNDGTLAGNRIVTQGANTLAFTGTAANAFSVDGTTLSVDAAANKIGAGTATPQNELHVNGNLQVTKELNVGGTATTTGSAGTTGQILTSTGPGTAPSWQTLNTVAGTISSVNYVQGTTPLTIPSGTTADVPGVTITLTVPAGRMQTFMFTILGYASVANPLSSTQDDAQGVFSLLQNGVKVSSAYVSKHGNGDTLANLPTPVTFLKALTLPAGTYIFKVQYAAWSGEVAVNRDPTFYVGYNGDTEALLTKMQVLVYNN